MGAALVLVVACGAPVALLVAWRLFNVWLHKATGIPNPPSLPLLGNLLDIQEHSWHGYHLVCLDRFGEVVRHWHGATQHINVMNLQGVTQCLNRLSYRFLFPAPMSKTQKKLYQSDLLFAANMQYHKALKSMWLPAFHPESLAQYYHIIVKCSDKLLAVCELAAASGQYVDISKYLSSMTMEVTGACGFGILLDCFSADARALGGSISQEHFPQGSTPEYEALGRKVVEAVRTIIASTRPETSTKWLPVFLMLPWASDLVSWLSTVFPDKSGRLMAQAMQDLQQVGMDLIKDQRALMKQQQGGRQAKADRTKGLLPGTFLRHLLETSDAVAAGKETQGVALTDEQVAANVVLFLSAGNDTTSVALSCTVFQLARPNHAHYLKKVYEELDAYGAGKTPSPADLDSCFPYLEACLKEALRLNSPVSFISRVVDEDMDLAGKQGIRLTKGTLLEVCVYALHHNPAVWRDPYRFLPDRFLSGQTGTTVDPEGFLPFGGGQRMCPGRKLALMEAKLTLVRMLQRFRFEIQPGFVLKTITGVMTGPADGIPVKILPRNPA